MTQEGAPGGGTRPVRPAAAPTTPPPNEGQAFRDKLLSLSYLGGGRTRDRVTERRDEGGRLVKATTDPLGNTVTQHTHDRQDVHINLPAVRAYMGVEEVR